MAGDAIHSKVETITPERARHLLENQNTHNRPLNSNTVDGYSRTITEGRWKVTHQGIAFDTNNALVDGQHRLAAIAKSGTPVQMMVTYNLDPEEFAVIDAGRRRTPADALGIAGVDRNRNQIASTTKFLALYDMQGEGKWTEGHETRLDNERTVEATEKYGIEKLDYVARVGSTHARPAGINITVLSSFFYLAHYRYGISTNELFEFLEGVSSGAGLDKGDPRLTLRNTMMQSKQHNAKLDRTRRKQFIAVVKAWNAYVSGKRMLRLTVRDEEVVPKISTVKNIAVHL